MQAGKSIVHKYIKSMTGFGRGRHILGDLEVVVEIRSVNHRFLDISVKMPKFYNCFEPEIRRIIADSIQRGKLDVAITRTGGKSTLMDVVLDYNLAENYHKCLLELKEKFDLAGTITLSDMLTLKEVISPLEKAESIEREWPLVENSLRKALSELEMMRKTEGAALWLDIESRLNSIGTTAGFIGPLVDQVTVAVKDRLERRVRELTGGLELNVDRPLQEVALMAERSDVTEELTRLQSHVEQFLCTAREGSPLGRKLDFLLQELQREVNTLGSKSASTDIAAHVVKMKAEVEKIREQTQNIE